MKRSVAVPSRIALTVILIASVQLIAPLTDASTPEPTPADCKTGLIPRHVLFGNPDKASPRISPDGKLLGFLAPVDGVMNVWVGPIDRPDEAKPLTRDKKRGIRTFSFAYTNNHVLYLQDTDGDENHHVYAVDLKSGEARDLTPDKNVQARIEGTSHKFPNEILVALNDRDPKLHDLYRFDIRTGKRTLVRKNTGFLRFETDDDYTVRFGFKMLPDGDAAYLRPDGEDGWQDFLTVPMADSLLTSILGFDKSGTTVFMRDSRDRDTAALTTLNIDSKKQKVLAEDARADAGGLLLHPIHKVAQAVSFTYDRTVWKFLDDAVKADFDDELRKLGDGEVSVTSRTLDDNTWIVLLEVDNGPVRYYVYDRPAKKARYLFSNRKDMEGLPLQKMHTRIIKSRDGLNLVSYLTLPPGSDPDGNGKPSKPIPMILNVHGGPWSRDGWGFDSEHQFLANRGYAVLSVNFRGSEGFGKKFLNAGNKEWAGKMHDDLIDAVNWAVKEKIANPAKVAIYGGSYGGYATLVGLTFTPDTFACGVDIVGPSNIVTLLNTIPPYWAPMIQMFKDRVGDHTTEEGRKYLEARSPLAHVDKISRPLLIAQGANDPRVKQSESDQIVKAMQGKNIPVTYTLFPDEGHGFARPENRLAFFAVTEAFLAKHLGGRFEAIGDAFKGSSITVPTGAGDVPGVAATIKSTK